MLLIYKTANPWNHHQQRPNKFCLNSIDSDHHDDIGQKLCHGRRDANLEPEGKLGQTTGLVILGAVGLIFVLAIIAITIRAIKPPLDAGRYGPQPARPGRLNQSRAHGLTRAMLDTIPIVRFAESNNKDANGVANTDVGAAYTVPASVTQSTTVNGVQGRLWPAERTIQTRPGPLECSICLGEFVKSEEIRVLSCNHKFHLACIDPWLLDISGTCPICRHDLCFGSNISDPAANLADDLVPPPPASQVSDRPLHRLRISSRRQAANTGPEGILLRSTSHRDGAT